MRKLFLAAALALATALAPASAQVQPASTSNPSATAAETATTALLRALNGSEAERVALVKSAFSKRSLNREDDDARLRWLNKIAADTGGFTIASQSPQGERMVEAILRSKHGGKFGKLVIFISKEEPGKINDLFLLPARDPAKVKGEAWPVGPLSLSRIGLEIEKRASALAAEDKFSGVVLVAKDGKVIVNRAYGLADQQWRIPNRTDTAFHLGSIGKMFTATAIMRLAAEDRLSLDDPLAKWVPEYPSAEGAPITLRQLLTHSAGIGEWDGRAIRRPLTGAEAAATMTTPLQFAPGERFSYSNAGFVLLGAVIEKATSLPLAEALQQLVFDRVGMKRTGLWPVTSIVPNRATGYLHSEDDPLGLAPRYSNEQFLGHGADGSGGEYSTTTDMFAFLSALGEGRLLGKLTDEMLTPRVNFAGASRPSKYGYGVDRGSCAGHPMFGHEGGGPNSGVSSLAYRTVDTRWTIIVLSNYDPPFPGDLAMSICEFVAGR
ncbi:MAG: beta-lactamase family protein [Pseudomonadota bacterium]|nr:beta-lactamase family protein [Pseudomonadota bacterium]